MPASLVRRSATEASTAWGAVSCAKLRLAQLGPIWPDLAHSEMPELADELLAPQLGEHPCQRPYAQGLVPEYLSDFCQENVSGAPLEVLAREIEHDVCGRPPLRSELTRLSSRLSAALRLPVALLLPLPCLPITPDFDLTAMPLAILRCPTARPHPWLDGQRGETMSMLVAVVLRRPRHRARGG